MKGIAVRTDGGAIRLVWEQLSGVQPGRGEVLVAVKAAGVNRADLLQAAGKYPPPQGASPILGLEVAGEIIQIGPEVTGWKGGERVMALLAGGGYAEQVVVPAGQLIPIPDALSFSEAAALPEAFITAYLNIVIEGQFAKGQSVLIHAGASGVGAAATQLVRVLGGRVFVTVGSEEKAAFCRSLGAELAVNYREGGEFAVPVMSATNGVGVDIILDCIGARYLNQNIRALAPGGHMISIGLMGGRSGELDLGLVLEKMLVLKGSKLRVRSTAEKAQLTACFRSELLPRFESGELHPTIDRVYPIEAAEEAHRRMAENLNLGKIVLKVAD